MVAAANSTLAVLAVKFVSAEVGVASLPSNATVEITLIAKTV